MRRSNYCHVIFQSLKKFLFLHYRSQNPFFCNVWPLESKVLKLWWFAKYAVGISAPINLQFKFSMEETAKQWAGDGRWGRQKKNVKWFYGCCGFFRLLGHVLKVFLPNVSPVSVAAIFRGQHSVFWCSLFETQKYSSPKQTAPEHRELSSEDAGHRDWQNVRKNKLQNMA